MENFLQILRKKVDSTFKKRTYSTIAITFFLTLLMMGGPAVIEIMLIFICLGLIYEWVKMCNLHAIIAPMFMTMIMSTAMFAEYIHHHQLAFGILSVGSSLSILMSWFAWRRRLLWMAGGILYIGIPLISMLWILENVYDSLNIFRWILLIVAGNDIFAYLFGISFGGPKLIPQISPNKTWSGFAGGLGGAVILGLIGAPAFISCYKVIFSSLIIAILATIGDFLESFIKRKNSVKDSGRLIPGHGGLFDRLDGFLLVFPLVAWVCFNSAAELSITLNSASTVEILKENIYG